ncbi:hypothetical protein BaRGS_00004043 [Batillaria attramentaria]|uniref:Ubiquitinyl hydrolase 1 n=1 Tax=Batillaria attramentaria TaxID=370345 RepID=A0ABD0LYH2_9CAEN
MASQSAAKQDHDDVGDDKQVPQASGPRQESSKMPKLNGNLEDSNISNGPLSADVPVNSLGNGASTDVSPSSAVCASQNGACPGYPCLNGFLPGRPRTAAIVSFQPNCPPNSSEVLDAVGAFRSNGSTPHACEGDDGDCVDQRVPESEAASFSQDTRKRGSRPKKPKRIVCRIIENGVDGASVDRVMIWNEYEAYLLQVKQIGMSACGQTAVLNLLKAFDSPAEKRDVCSKIHVNLRKEKASVAEYLASRAVAGTTAEELLAGVERLTKGELRGRFFPFWPPRDVQLLSWISLWMKKGAVPIATLNLQLGVKQQQVPDAWHHQMVYGVGPRGVYLTNPLEIVPEETMMEQLTSDSVLLVRRQDVVSRFQPTASLAPLMRHQDPRWCTMNVLGQVVNVLREHNMPSVPGYRAQVTSHVRIPAVYRAGVTLFVRHNTEEWKALRDAPELPRKTDRQDSGVE